VIQPPLSDTAAHTKAAQRVLLIEADALRSLAQHLPADFAAAVSAILHVKGRVIVAGMGKSGHVARKIAGTLASTGTPSFFVHPAEASHGDLGMVMPGDICILLSNSGETAELRDLTAHCLRFDVPIIGMSSGTHSSLMQAATLRLTLPNLPEACAIGMAGSSTASPNSGQLPSTPLTCVRARSSPTTAMDRKSTISDTPSAKPSSQARSSGVAKR
jgi:arabinose-5-phosphate isomerase